MADIELVIKIPEEIYQRYKALWQKRRGSVPESCIAFGTPLPKGHGRLIDVDALIHRQTHHGDWGTVFELVDSNNLKCAPTIIEADKEKDK